MRCYKIILAFIFLQYVNWNCVTAQNFYIDSNKIDIIGKPIILNLNNDEYPDLLVLKTEFESTSNAKLFINNKGNFIEKENFNLDNVALFFRGSADFNNDSFQDLVFSECKDGKYHSNLYLNDGNANFTINQKLEFNVGSTFSDINGDGFKDIVCVKSQQKFDEIVIYFNNNGSFQQEQKANITVNGQIKEIHTLNNRNDLVVYYQKTKEQEYLNLIKLKKKRLVITDSIPLGGNYIRTSLQVLSSKKGKRNQLIFTGFNRLISLDKQLSVISYAIKKNEIVEESREFLPVTFDYYHGGASIFSDKNYNYVCLTNQLPFSTTLLKCNAESYNFVKINVNFRYSCYESGLVEINDTSDFDNIDFRQVLAYPDNSFYITHSATGDIDNDGDIDIIVTRDVFGKCEKGGIYVIYAN